MDATLIYFSTETTTRYCGYMNKKSIFHEDNIIKVEIKLAR